MIRTKKGVFPKDHPEAIAFMEEQKAAAEASKTIQQKRAEEYPPVGDVVDSLCKSIEHIITELNVTNFGEWKQLQSKRSAIKAKYPKN